MRNLKNVVYDGTKMKADRDVRRTQGSVGFTRGFSYSLRGDDNSTNDRR